MTDQQFNEQRMHELARKWQEGTITPQERLEFDQWFDSFDDSKMAKPAGENPEELRERLYASIRTREKIGQRTGGRILSTRWTVAAAVLLLLGSAAWWQALRSARSLPVVAAVPLRPDKVIVPGSNKAILTLGNGSQLILDSAKDGLLAQQGSTMIMKEKNGVVRYGGNAAEENAADNTAPLYNTITTPRGGQYSVTLPDGSKVWLNAASSIRFPTAFAGASRDVEVQGEVYFEIAPDKTKPFRVAVNKKMDVEVLGTEFNVMAYEEESTIKTTLINGAVRVVKGNEGRVLRPGQQAQLRPDGIIHTLNNADIEATIAWKNGRTIFAGEDIPTIMRKVSRWYDIDVEYRGNITERKFTGGIARNSDISVVLKILELNQIHYSVEGKKIVLMP
jgi:transmembrane sensor